MIAMLNLAKNWKSVMIDKVICAVVWTALTLVGITLFLKLADWYWKVRERKK